MTDYQRIWELINEESADSTGKTQIAKKIHCESNLSVFLATDFGKSVRMLYIKPCSDHGILIENLPRFRGLDISLTYTSLGSFKNEEFLKLTQSIPDTDNIFELIISDITDIIVRLRNEKHLYSTLVKVLNEWKIFFEKKENKVMSLQEQQGLAGELYFLRDYMLGKYSGTEALLYWTGADRTNHDFQIESVAVEIKTTSGKQHKKFTVASERQLDSTGLEHLYLVLFSLNIHHNQPILSLSALIEEISEMMRADLTALYQFQIKLAKCGYSEKTKDQYDYGFSISSLRIFEVKENFPRLIADNLPSGIGDLKYTVSEASCMPFEIKTDILKLI